MNIKKTLMVAGVATTLGIAGIGSMGIASAATDTSTNTIIDKIATKFNLDKEDVAAVFEEEKAAREVEHKQKLEERLQQAVIDGKLTSAQKDKILAKLAELKTEREAAREQIKDKTHEERREAMDQKRDDLKQWAADNDIPVKYLHMAGGHHHHGPKGEKTVED